MFFEKLTSHSFDCKVSLQFSAPVSTSAYSAPGASRACSIPIISKVGKY